MNRRLVPFCRVTVYESTNRFYLVGSDLGGDRYCLLKIDRTEGKELAFSNGGHEYTKKELNEVLAMIHGSHAAASTKTTTTYVLNERIERAKGLLGFVRFLEGYYMVAITACSKVAQLGYHDIYKIDETDMIYIPSKSDTQQNNAEEQRYVKLFQSVDLATDFYFSYTYDLTRTLQENITRPKATIYEKYVWNSYLLEPMVLNAVNSRWILPIVHGYLGSCALSIKGFTYHLLLLARRSNKFAGTRFLKRGANNRGYVANEVETEQIFYDSSLSSFERGRFTSFVQLRGSVPLVWSQDLTKVVGKPPIQLHYVDPFAVIPALHFQELRNRYNDPIIVINLVKRRERRRHESILNDEFRTSISYLNQFLDPEEAILYLSFDMARCHKMGSALPKLEEIGYNVVKLNGWFQTFPPLYCHQLRPDMDNIQHERCGRFLLQTGVPRMNCVDCLDRTNVAQFVIGKVALSYQLYSLGLLDVPRLNLDTEICRILESLYEGHGDTLALQYAGSQLVHSIRTYKKISVFQERSRDVIQTISRYYSNTFSDYDKQNAINLFLGIFRPYSFKPHLWELANDWYLHNPFSDSTDTSNIDYCAWFETPEHYSKAKIIERRLPSHFSEGSAEIEQEQNDDDIFFDRHYRTFEMTSMDSLVFRQQREVVQIDSATSPPTLSSQPFMKTWKKQEGNASRRQSRRKSQDERKKHHRGDGGEEHDQDESSSEEDPAAHSDTEIQYSTPWYGMCTTPQRQNDIEIAQDSLSNGRASVDVTNVQGTIMKSTPFTDRKSMITVYGVEIKQPSKKDLLKYGRYAQLGGAYDVIEDEKVRTLVSLKEQPSYRYDTLQPLSMFTNDSTFGVAVPVVSESARQMYQDNVDCGLRGARIPSSLDCLTYAQYAQEYHKLLLGLDSRTNGDDSTA